MENRKSDRKGLGLGAVLTIIFVVLKLIGSISWSWIWVLSPIWISWSIIIVLVIVNIILKKMLDK